MITVIKISNPFEPFKDMVVENTQATSVLEYLATSNWDGFERPTVCLVNGEPIFQAQYRDTLNDGDKVTFVTLAGNPLVVIIAIVVAVVAVAIALSLTPQPPNIGDIPEPDSVFTLRGQSNQAKLGQCIPSHYGRIRNFPDYGARPYNQYEGNDQYQFSLFCLGHGSYTVENLQFDDTPIASFPDVQVQVALPGQEITLFPDAVSTSSEVGSIELFAPNQSEHTGHAGPYVANDVGTLSNKIQIDVTLPRGLYLSNDSGGLNNLTASASFEYRSAGTSGPWLPLVAFSQTLKTTTPQRYTLTKDLPLGRWEVRAIRTNNKNTSHRAGDIVVWESMRCFLPSVKKYGNVTMVAVKAKATNSLNDRSRVAFNCVQTRLLPIYNPTTSMWSAPTATRSPYWAMVDIFRSTYGGRVPDSFLDLIGLSQAAAAAAARADNFDFTYNQRTGLWDAAKLALSVDRAVPMLNGSQVTAIRDELQTLAKAVFTPSNMIQGTFTWDANLWTLGEHDGLEIEYLDEDTWKLETVNCLVALDQGLSLKNVKLNGVVNRNKAYRMGLFMRAQEVYRRQRVFFETGLEGHIPAFNSMAAITYDLPRWGQSGLVVSANGNEIELSEFCVFTPSKNHKIQFRKRDGSASPAYPVVYQPGATRKVVVVGTITEDFNRNQTEERVFYQFGVENLVAKNFKIQMLKPSTAQTVAVEAVIDDPRVYGFDSAVAPPKGVRSIAPVTPLAPTISNLSVANMPGTLSLMLVSWSPAVGAVQYVIETSTDGLSWATVATSLATSYILPVNPGPLWVRVAAIGASQGAYTTWNGTAGSATVPPEAPSGLTLSQPFTGSAAEIQWSPAILATSYIVEVRRTTGNSLLRSTEVTNTAYTYSLDQAFPDFAGTPSRDLTFQVFGKNNFSTSESSTSLAVVNPKAAVPSNITATIESQTESVWKVRLSWDFIFENDVQEYRLYASDVNNFTPSNTNLVVGAGIYRSVLIDVTRTGGPRNYFYRVACLDKWGSDFDYSTQRVIALV